MIKQSLLIPTNTFTTTTVHSQLQTIHKKNNPVSLTNLQDYSYKPISKIKFNIPNEHYQSKTHYPDIHTMQDSNQQ